jgi:putative transposase
VKTFDLSNVFVKRKSLSTFKKILRDAGDSSSKPEQQERRMDAVVELAKSTGVKKACDALCVSSASFYRKKLPVTREPKERSSIRALTTTERDNVKQMLYSERFMDKSPSQIYAQLLDEGQYYCSTRTMYRILERENAVKERRNQLRRPNYTKPELLASAPNQVWSWALPS